MPTYRDRLLVESLEQYHARLVALLDRCRAQQTLTWNAVRNEHTAVMESWPRVKDTASRSGRGGLIEALRPIPSVWSAHLDEDKRWHRYTDVLDEIVQAVELTIETITEAPDTNDGAHQPRTRSGGQPKRRAGAPRKLTDKQKLAFSLYVHHEGRINDVAEAMGVKHPTVIQHLNAAKKKIPQLAEQMKQQHAGKRQSLPTDRRGQVNL